MRIERVNQDLSQIEQQLVSLHQTPIHRDPDRERSGRNAYIRAISEIAVSKPEKNRLTFQDHIQSFLYSGKGKLKMSPILVSIIAAVALLFGGGSVGVVAAQNSLPDDLLYPLKLATEDVRMALANTPEEKIDLELKLGETRLSEIIQLLQKEKTPSEDQYERLDSHLMNAYQMAIGTNTQNSAELTMLRNRIQTQAQVMEEIQAKTMTQSSEVILTRTKGMLQSQINLVDETISVMNSMGAGNAGSEAGTGQQNQAQPVEQNQTQSIEQNQTQSMEQNQTQSMEQNQTQSMEQNQTQSMEQNQTQSMEQNQTQSMEQNQTQSMEQNQTQSMQKNQLFPARTATPNAMMSGNQGATNGNSGGKGK